MRELHINKLDIRDARIVDVTQAPLADGAVRLKLDLFALTANNITYAAMGAGVLGYWDFFPAPEGFGKVPVWGFATVTESRAPGVEAGGRYWGYYPLAESLDVTPAKTGPRGFADSAPHRAAKAAVYNQYANTAHDPAYDAAYEPEQTLFRPLYATGWWAADCIAQDNPRTVVLSSASSKTALATAHQLKALGGGERVALTSGANMVYVRDTGLYDRVIAYDDVATLRADGGATYVDFLGRGELIAAAHRALGGNLKRSLQIGATDWADRPGGVQPPAHELPGPQPEFFFVPSYAAGRLQSDARLGAAMLTDLRAFYPASRRYVTAHPVTGAGALADAWSRLAKGSVPPREGVVGSF
jgi:hypothetical protein